VLPLAGNELCTGFLIGEALAELQNAHVVLDGTFSNYQ